LSIFDLIWLFFLLSSLQPVLQKWYLTSMRIRAFRGLEKRRESRVIGLIHRQETMAFLGFPVARYIDIEDSEAVLRAIQLTDSTVPIDMILHTPGGLVLAASQIAAALHAHLAKVTVFVPHYAMSGGTLISLAADEIVMCSHSVLGPIDPQINGMPAASIIKVAAEKPLSDIDDQTLILADLGQKAIDQLRRQAGELIRSPMAKEAAIRLAEELTKGRWTHDYPISADEARTLGLNVNTNMPDEILDLLALFPQPVRMTQSVEFGPGPVPQ